MVEKTHKILLFIKRRPGMSVEEFRNYYESRHVPLYLKYIAGTKRYVRRYLDPQPHPETGSGEDLGYDVITELWFDNETVFRATVKHLSTNTLPEEVIEDEKQLFDRSSFRMATCTETVTDLG